MKPPSKPPISLSPPPKLLYAHAIAKRGANYILLRYLVSSSDGEQIGEPDHLAMIEGHAGDALIDHASQGAP